MVALILAGLIATACTTSQVLEPAALEVPDSPKHAAIVVDGNTGRVMYAYNATAERYPASLTKMMTLYMMFEAMQQGRMSLHTQIPISAQAARRPPSKIGFRSGDSIDAEAAITALVVKSANDVACAVAEYLGGTEERFAEMMTAKARALGMNRTRFRNASGLPDDAQVTTAEDMARLGISLRRDFPQYYDYFAKRVFAYNGRTIKGHNDILETVRGANGIKTGYIRASGYNLAASVDQDGKRVVAVVMGGKTADSRNAYMEELVRRYLPKSVQR
ncbi:D-alanyl-D-alanine carboxypeptidase family protein [Mesorhizobium xinjiangense]|uniref:D-alanyl-D-alanine carboxypeptidase family protein n=1 Tax=Mesorhizobium xinjiangense TaxID=2678685 RepID=UPI0012ED4B60